jgi:hypothetical protein
MVFDHECRGRMIARESIDLLLAASLGLEDALDDGSLLDQERAGDAVCARKGSW